MMAVRYTPQRVPEIGNAHLNGVGQVRHANSRAVQECLESLFQSKQVSRPKNRASAFGKRCKDPHARHGVWYAAWAGKLSCDKRTLSQLRKAEILS